MSSSVSASASESRSEAVGIAARRVPAQRLAASAVLVVTLGVLVVAAHLEPATAGYGTHEELGLPACGFRDVTSLPCATCGMTTAFSHAAHGNLLTAFAVQPAGTLLALLTAMGAVVSSGALVFGFSLAPLGRLLSSSRAVLILCGLGLAGWLYTILAGVGSSGIVPG